MDHLAGIGEMLVERVVTSKFFRWALVIATWLLSLVEWGSIAQALPGLVEILLAQVVVIGHSGMSRLPICVASPARRVDLLLLCQSALRRLSRDQVRSSRVSVAPSSPSPRSCSSSSRRISSRSR